MTQGQGEVKLNGANISPQYAPLVDSASAGNKVPRGTTCWYVFGVLATIFCCLPCGVIGMVHAMIARHEGERGNYAGHRRRLYQAKCWTSWSIALGLVSLIVVALYTIGVTVGFGYMGRMFCGVTGPYWRSWNGTQWNGTLWNDEIYPAENRTSDIFLNI